MLTTAEIDGMRSVHCTRAIFTALAALGGGARAEVSMGRVVIEHDGHVTAAALRAVIEALGYTVRAVSEDRRRLIIQETSARGDPEG